MVSGLLAVRRQSDRKLKALQNPNAIEKMADKNGLARKKKCRVICFAGCLCLSLL